MRKQRNNCVHTMKVKEIKTAIAAKKPEELVEFVRTERETLRASRFQGTGVSNSARATRKNIARALTAIRNATAA